MNKNSLTVVFIALLGLRSFVGIAQEKGVMQPNTLAKVAGVPNRTHFNINRLQTTIHDDGRSDYNYNKVGDAGLIYPKGSGKSAIYATGFVWGAQYGIGGAIRLGGTAYRTGLQGGKILPGLIAESPSLPKNRVYRVRPDIPPGNTSANVESEEQDGEGASVEIYDQYHKDWMEWPWQDGAPYNDKDSNATYDPAIDIPGVPGADQTIWFVANDLDPVRTNDAWACNPIGIELQGTIWGYNRESSLGSMMFRRYLLINKSTVVFDSMYVGLWVDPDLGFYNDDFVGCDTTRSLAFVYNAKETDVEYEPLPPPSIGFDFFQGPTVPGSAADSAIYLGERVYGRRNLPMSAFIAYASNSPDQAYRDPAYGTTQGIAQFYNYLKGYTKFGAPWVEPGGGQTAFPFSGNPETQTGWLDGQIFPAGDRRLGLSSGPFTMGVGDTQEVVIAEIAAGAIEGTDRLSAVALLKFYDDEAQLAYDSFFDLPKAPPAPLVTAIALDCEIVLSWNDTVRSTATENSNARGYPFQGYNVYQLPFASATVSDGKRIATYDIIDDVQKIKDRDFDPTSGEVVTIVRQYGTDNGIQRFIRIKKNAFNNSYPLVNGIPYYFAVTAYNYNPDPLAVPRTLENPLQIITVVPHRPDPGTRYGGSPGDTILVTQTTAAGASASDGSVIPLIIDPTKLTGDSYSVSFDTLGGATVWNLTNESTGKVMLANQSNLGDNELNPFIDGIRVKVFDIVPGMKAWTVPVGSLTWTSNGSALNLNGLLEGFGGAIGNAYDHWFSGGAPYSNLRNVLVQFASTDTNGNLLNPSDPNVSRGYRYMRNAALAPARPEFTSFIVNPSAGYAYQDYNRNVPLAAFNMETNPPTRLMVGYLENNAAGGMVDGMYWPPDYHVTGNAATASPREWLFIFDVPYSDTPDPALQVNILNVSVPMMWFCTAARDGNVAFAAGDQFLIAANHPNTPDNTFAFTAPPTIVQNVALARQDVQEVNVFPNPYYGVNPQEIDKYRRFVTFSHLPNKAIIRIFNLAGVMVRRIDRESTSQFEQWDLKNENGLPVGSGLYVAHIEMPEIGVSKILKIAIVQERQLLDRY